MRYVMQTSNSTPSVFVQTSVQGAGGGQSLETSTLRLPTWWPLFVLRKIHLTCVNTCFEPIKNSSTHPLKSYTVLDIHFKVLLTNGNCRWSYYSVSSPTLFRGHSLAFIWTCIKMWDKETDGSSTSPVVAWTSNHIACLERSEIAVRNQEIVQQRVLLVGCTDLSFVSNDVFCFGWCEVSRVIPSPWVGAATW